MENHNEFLKQFADKNLLITGGCGFIGCNFADKLLARGDEVILMDNLSRIPRHDWLLDSFFHR